MHPYSFENTAYKYEYLVFYFNRKAFNYWFELPDDQMNLVKDMVELLHNSSLL